MSDRPFRPGDEVLHRRAKDTSNIGEVMDLHSSEMKPGHLAVYFQRQVWIKPKNLIHLDEWKPKLPKERSKPMGEYRVTGTASYYVDGGDDENFKPINTLIVAASKEDAAEEALEENDSYQYGEELSWLVGYPTVELIKYVHVGPSLHDYWTKGG
jgi:hypothetical protein